MTTPRYPTGCRAGSQAPGAASSPDASAPADYAWIVNFNNGNSNYNDRNNNAFVRAVRSVGAGEYPGAGQVRFGALHEAWRRARAGKMPSANQLAFDRDWIGGLFDLQAALNAHTWSPRPTTCFIAQRPKARQIHAPDFADRVVHQWLVPQLERVFDPGFIADSYANRVGKGSHAAVTRLRGFMRQVHSGQGGGWYLQLDVANFFNSIHRPTLYRMLKRRMERAQLPLAVQRATHALLRQSVQKQGVVHRSTPAERACVPAHKRLENAPAGHGLPIGNLSSQFFANVYLDALDQFCKHTLKAQRYLRYVDDFVLVHHDRAVLVEWRDRIEAFLRDTLRLELKAEQKLQPLTDGIDFLGYVVHPTHTRVRRRVVSHARAALAAWEGAHVQPGTVTATPAEYRAVQSVWASYQGHFRHANARRLTAGMHRRFTWLHAATTPRRFHHRLEGQPITIRGFA